MGTRRLQIGMLIALSCLWGSSWIANSLLASFAAPIQVSLLRYLFGWLALAVPCGVQLLLVRFGSPESGPPVQAAAAAASVDNSPAPQFAILRALEVPGAERNSARGMNLLLGCTMFGIPDLLLVAAAHHGAAAFTPLIYAGMPLGLAIAAGGLRVSAILGIGAMLVLLNGSMTLSPTRMLWALLIVAAVALQGWSLLFARRHLPAVSSMRGCLGQLMAAAFVLNLALNLVPERGGVSLPLRTWPAGPIAALGALAVLGTALAYPLFYRLLARLEPAQLAVTAWLQTLVAVAESALLLHQRPSWLMVAAAAVLVICTADLLRPASPMAESPLELFAG